ncbi:metal-dependent hydrolase [Leifsonia sp. fls2-241-R2A-40a]|uniref:metal-dependent hydrolase n=1 Tax=Leifsonia sp. fls2-241-R2A-40a TaxID=3040290 RepID=UPI00254E7D8A|nr:metal-dependent hydrolase [Leifsonia sp. fls2-241-R2A-40a]
MSLPSIDTAVTYPDGDLTSTGAVLHVEPLADGRAAVILDRTAFHPVDPVWPDQPADAGVLSAGGRTYDIVDAVVGATDGTVLHVGDAPVRTGTEGWAFVVCHLVDDPAGLAEGDAVTISVDAARRHALSAGHTACHLASLALNEALSGLWTKEVTVDGRGRPNFDQLAISSSRILEGGSIDEYRIGKSLRKKGFAAADLAAQLDEVEAAANRALAGWLATGAPVSIAREGGRLGLGDRRYWRAELPEGVVEIPCGGTHLRSLGELTEARVQLELSEAEGALALTMRTTARIA